MVSEKSKILVVGATGYLGRHVVLASARLGHPTFALVRDTAPSDAAKAAVLKSFKDAGVTLLKGDLYDHASLVTAAKAADVVISTLGSLQIGDQTKLIDAIKEAGNVKPGKFILAGKVAVRRATEASGIPYTFAVAGYFAGYALPNIGQVLAQGPPVDKAVVLGDGNTKVVYVDEGDIATYTVLAADDPRAENKTLYIKPPANTLSHNELLSLWEKKTGKKFERVYIPDEAVLKQIQGELPPPPPLLPLLERAGSIATFLFVSSYRNTLLKKVTNVYFLRLT
nr:unnamed protein product [Digitaria exilis]